MTIVEVGLGAALIIVPLTGMSWFDTRTGVGVSMAIGSVIAVTSNAASAALTLAFVVAAITLGLHRLMWPIIARPLYLLADLRIFATRKTRAAVLAVGIALISVAIGKGALMLALVLALFSGR